MTARADAPQRLLDHLRAQDYHFITPTPATHARVIARPDMAAATDLRGAFGWSLPFAPDLLPQALRTALLEMQVLERAGADRLHSRVRVSSLDDGLFLHSAYPTTSPDSVFFGPDSYRFVRFIAAELEQVPCPVRIVDLGAGSGVGGIMAARLCPGADVVLLDINPAALELAAVNARAAGVPATTLEAGSLAKVEGPVDLILANPPFIIDAEERTYRHGGDMDGARVSYDWTLASAERLQSGGRMLLYTGVAIRDGQDPLRTALERDLSGCTLRYRELDPDIFGEELDRPAYAGIERIAAVGVEVIKD